MRAGVIGRLFICEVLQRSSFRVSCPGAQEWHTQASLNFCLPSIVDLRSSSSLLREGFSSINDKTWTKVCNASLSFAYNNAAIPVVFHTFCEGQRSIVGLALCSSWFF